MKNECLVVIQPNLFCILSFSSVMVFPKT